jgi:hypothetical protein
MLAFPDTLLATAAHIVYNFFIVLFTILFMKELYPKKYPGRLPFIIAFIISFLALCGVNAVGSAVLNGLFSFIMINILCFTLFKTTFNPAFFYNIVLLMMVFIAESISIALTALGSDKKFDHELTFNEFETAIGLLTCTLICFAMLRIANIIMTKRAGNPIGRGEIIMLIFMLLFESFIFNHMIENIIQPKSLLVLFVTIIGFLVLNIVVVYEIHKIAVLYKVKYEADIIKQQNALQITHYNEMMGNYTHYRRLVHDIKKHMTILTGITAFDNAHYKDYQKALNEKIELLFDEYQSKNPILSVVTTQKIRAAKIHGIRLVLRMEDIDISFMENIDITALFANLWDNAIEACLEIPPELRLIKVGLVYKEELIVIRFENSFTGDFDIDIEKTEAITTKGDEHAGLGLQIIKAVAKKYGGHFVVSGEGPLFIATVMMGERH